MESVKRIAILGAGESGLGAARLARKNGVSVFLSELQLIPEKLKVQLVKLNVEIEERFHTLANLIEGVDFVIKSPGIPNGIQILKKIKESGVPIISEIEWASMHCNKPVIAITGSNGKTTTTLLTTHILNSAGRNAISCGNIGNSFSAAVADDKADIFVVEVSSFQLDDILSFKPNVAAVLNITPDHLDRYRSFDHYAHSKKRITENQSEDDILVIDEQQKQLESIQTNATSISILPQEIDFIQLNSGITISSHETDLIGRHNMLNAAFASEIALQFGVSEVELRSALSTFKNAPHRLENVATINGIQYINDSKATNLDAVQFALEGIEKNIIWIAGGVDKGNDYTLIQDLVAKKVKAIIILSEETSAIENAFSHIVLNIIDARSASESIRLANRYANDGDVVLLSPACASFDLFDNYIDRGNQFKEAVKQLKNK